LFLLKGFFFSFILPPYSFSQVVAAIILSVSQAMQDQQGLLFFPQ